MKLHNLLISILVILIVVVSYLAGFLSKDFYKEIMDDYNYSKAQQEAQFRQTTVKPSNNPCKLATSTEAFLEKEGSEYKRILAMRECEAAKIRADIFASTTKSK